MGSVSVSKMRRKIGSILNMKLGVKLEKVLDFRFKNPPESPSENEFEIGAEIGNPARKYLRKCSQKYIQKCDPKISPLARSKSGGHLEK